MNILYVEKMTLISTNAETFWVQGYDCVEIVKSWLSLWLVNEAIQYKKPKHEKWFFIAWIFEREKTFKNLTTKVDKKKWKLVIKRIAWFQQKILLNQMFSNIIDKFCIMHHALCVCMMSIFAVLNCLLINFIFSENILNIRHDIIRNLFNVFYDYIDCFANNKKTVRKMKQMNVTHWCMIFFSEVFKILTCDQKKRSMLSISVFRIFLFSLTL